jgi:hypothetical protein
MSASTTPTARGRTLLLTARRSTNRPWLLVNPHKKRQQTARPLEGAIHRRRIGWLYDVGFDYEGTTSATVHVRYCKWALPLDLRHFHEGNIHVDQFRQLRRHLFFLDEPLFRVPELQTTLDGHAATERLDPCGASRFLHCCSSFGRGCLRLRSDFRPPVKRPRRKVAFH